MPATQVKSNLSDFTIRVHLVHRIGISLGISLLTWLAVFHSRLDRLVVIMIIWNAFALTFIFISWMVFISRTPEQMRARAREEDGSRVFVFLLILISCFASMFAVLSLILSQDSRNTPLYIYVSVAIGTMLFSWFMVHTTFCFHYAHLYYDDAQENRSVHAGGLEFPKDKQPDYLDFVYFSYVIGMTFQVSDVAISSRTIRRLALLHGLVSFILNTFVVALTINLIAGLKH